MAYDGGMGRGTGSDKDAFAAVMGRGRGRHEGAQERVQRQAGERALRVLDAKVKEARRLHADLEALEPKLTAFVDPEGQEEQAWAIEGLGELQDRLMRVVDIQWHEGGERLRAAIGRLEGPRGFFSTPDEARTLVEAMREQLPALAEAEAGLHRETALLRADPSLAQGILAQRALCAPGRMSFGQRRQRVVHVASTRPRVFHGLRNTGESFSYLGGGFLHWLEEDEEWVTAVSGEEEGTRVVISCEPDLRRPLEALRRHMDEWSEPAVGVGRPPQPELLDEAYVLGLLLCYREPRA
jgi:hypothetical protein